MRPMASWQAPPPQWRHRLETGVPWQDSQLGCDGQREYWHTLKFWLALKSNCLHTASGMESGTPLELRKQRAPLRAQRLGRRRCRGRFRALRRLPTFASLLCGPPPLASLEEMKDTQASMLRLEQAALCEMACTVRLPLHEARSSRRLARATPRHATSLVVANGGEPRRE